MADRLKLSAPQRALLEEFRATSAKSALPMGLSADQVRAMSLTERLDYWSQHMTRVAASAQADATGLRKFYGSLTADQRAGFDTATRVNQARSTVAADVLEAPTSDAPNYRLPARTEADWLIKPTAENISRVYPSAAMERRESGSATLSCTVDEDGYLKDCQVLSETPKELGFGNAALEVTGYMRMQPATEYGVPVLGIVRIPLTFNLPPPD